jgi:hypothetical protein
MTAIFACAICIVACNSVRCSSQNERREKTPVINGNRNYHALHFPAGNVTAGTIHKFRLYYGNHESGEIYKPLIPQSLDLSGRMLCGESCFRFISGGIGKLTRDINDGG